MVVGLPPTLISTLFSDREDRHTSPLSLFTSICRASRPVSAGKLIAGPRLVPSSAFLNCTTTEGMIASGGGVTRGRRDLEYADFCRFGGGKRVAMVAVLYVYSSNNQLV